MGVQAGKTHTTKKVYFSQAPVGSSFNLKKHFLLSPAQTVLTEQKGTSSLRARSGL